MSCKEGNEAEDALSKNWFVGDTITYKPISAVTKLEGIEGHVFCLFALVKTKTKFGAFV